MPVSTCQRIRQLSLKDTTFAKLCNLFGRYTIHSASCMCNTVKRNHRMKVAPEINRESLQSIAAKRAKKKPVKTAQIDYVALFLIVLVILISIFTMPVDWSVVRAQHVWYYGWITAVSTGVGVLPFFFFSEPNKYWMGISNAVAGGMMLAASYSLVVEGASFEPEHLTRLASITNINVLIQPIANTVIGFASGILFILATKQVLGGSEVEEEAEEAGPDTLRGVGWEKMVLIMFVMTLHSLTEGVGIGVSFGGIKGMQLGQFIALSLAVHNIPEGLAVGLVLTTRKVSKVRAVLWAIFTSLPQPIFAIPAFLFVEKFATLLPIGLGFAAGAMSYVAVFELLFEAVEETSLLATAGVGAVACFCMTWLQECVRAAV